MNKKILYIVIIIIFVVAGIFVAKQISQNKEAKPTVANVLENNNKIENKVVKNNNVVEQENNIVKNNEVGNNQVETEITTQTPEEQAKQIVKDNWGEDDTVYYSYDGKDEKGRYVICVREKSSTKALYRYYVDIETGTFDIE